MKTARRFILAVSVLMVPNPVWAHHSYAMFDQTKKLTVQGTVRALEWANPHVWLWVDVSDGAGSTVSYGFESNAPSELARFFGWNKLSVIAGNKITVDYSPLKSGRNGGALRTVTFSDGRILKTPRSDPEYVTGPRGAAPDTGKEVK